MRHVIFTLPFYVTFDVRRHFENKRGVFWDTFLLHLSYELHAMVSNNKMLSYHAHFLLYLVQEKEFILSRTTSCICRFCVNSDLQIGVRGRLRVRVLSSEHAHFESFRPLNLQRVLSTENSYS